MGQGEQRSLNDYSHHIASHLAANGFETALAGITHVARRPWYDIGEVYEHVLNHDDTGTPLRTETVRAAVSFLQREHSRPFFLAVGFSEPQRNNPHPAVFTRDWNDEPEDSEPR